MKFIVNDKTYEIKIAKYVIGVITSILGLMILFGSWFTVGAGEQAVVFDKFSGVKQETYGPGIHFKKPIIDSAIKYNVKSQLYTAQATGASSDLQEVHTEISVQYHPDPKWVNWIHNNLGKGYADVVVIPGVQESVKAATAKHLAVNLIINRSIVKEEITLLLRERLLESHIILEQTSITDFDFSPQFNAAIEAKVTAEQNALAAKNKLAQVEYEAQQKIAEARGQAEASRLLSENIEKNNGSAYLFLQWLQKWNGILPQVMTSGGSDTPIMIPVGFKE